MTAARQLEIRGEKRGIQLGMQQGMQQGRQEGIQQGMQQGIEYIAKNMLYKLHWDMKAVSEATGLGQAELAKLQKEGKAGS